MEKEKEVAEKKVVEIGENEAVEVQIMGFTLSGLPGDGPSKVVAEKVKKVENEGVEVHVSGMAGTSGASL